MMSDSSSRDSTKRFSGRVENYIKFRPGYPTELLEFLKSQLGLSADWIVADIGSGTGISSELFLQEGISVYSVEPNAEMLDASVRLLSDYPNFYPVNAPADATGIDSGTVDLVFAAQSFHWFNNSETVDEFRRILKPGGFTGLVWNERELDIDQFHIDYENFLKRFANDYEAIRHDNIKKPDIEGLFGTGFDENVFEYKQEFDFEGLLGRALSSSYMPDESSEVFREMSENLNSVFAKHAEFGKIAVSYKTKFYYTNF